MPLYTQFGGQGPVKGPRLMGGRDHCHVGEFFKIIMMWFCFACQLMKLQGGGGMGRGMQGWEYNYICVKMDQIYSMYEYTTFLLWSSFHS
jgi:hypothetical protein